jgi:hypothetical protein
MRFQVTGKIGAVVTLNRTFEIEAPSEEEAKRLVLSDEAHELPEDQFFILRDELDEIHSSEMDNDATELSVVRVG